MNQLLAYIFNHLRICKHNDDNKKHTAAKGATQQQQMEHNIP